MIFRLIGYAGSGSKEKTLNRRLNEDPKNISVLKELAELYEERKKFNSAASLFAQIADIHHGRGFLSEAIAYIKKAARLAPNEWRYLSMAGTYLQEKGFGFEAQPYFRRALELLGAASERRHMPEVLWKMTFLVDKPEHAAFQLVRLCLELGDHGKAEHYAGLFIAQALLKNKPDWIAHLLRGLGTDFSLDETLKGRAFEAIASSDHPHCQSFIQALQGKPGFEGLACGQPVSFEQIFEQFKQYTSPRIAQDQSAVYALATAYHDMGLFDAALATLERCEDNAQNRFEMLYLKAMVYKAKEDYDKSKGILSALAALSSLTISQFIGTHYELALAHEALSETDQAIAELEKVVMLDPTFGEAADRLARLRSSIGLDRSFPKGEGSL